MKLRACGTRPFKGPEQTARVARNMGGNPGENDVLQAKERANFQEGGIVWADASGRARLNMLIGCVTWERPEGQKFSLEGGGGGEVWTQ